MNATTVASSSAAHVQFRCPRAWERACLGLLLLAAGMVACAPNGAQTVGSGAVHRGPGPEVATGLQVGQRAPAFSVTGIDGRPVGSADLLAQDKPFILYFFATW